MHPSETSQSANNFTCIAQQKLCDIPPFKLLSNAAEQVYGRQQHLFSKEASINVMLVDELSNLLLNLWQLVNSNTFGNFLEKVLKLAGCYVPFDSAVWGCAHPGTDSHRVQPRIIFRLGIPCDALKEYTRISPNIRRDEVFAHPGTVFRYDNDNPVSGTTPELLEFDRKYDIHRACGILQKRDGSGLGLFIFLYRHNDKPHFSAQEAHFLELIIGHFSAAIEVYCSKLLNGKNGIGASGGGVALIDQSSLLLLANEPFHDLISRHWPGWQNPVIPDALLDCAMPKLIRGLVASMEPVSGEQFHLLSLRPEQALDGLTVRQLEIAQAYANGMEHKHIARKLHISPATVRNHLSNIYNQLQIKNKIELISALSARANALKF